MKVSTINTIIGAAALLLAIHLTLVAVFCFVLGALLMYAVSEEDRGN